MTTAADLAAVPPDNDVEAAPGGEPELATADFRGQTFKLNPELSEWAILEFAEAADNGEDGDELRGMASLLRFVVELVHPADRDRFRRLCRRERVGAHDLVEFLFGGNPLEASAERPTQRSSDSSDGPAATEPKSDASSDDKASPTSGLELLQGRPDLQLMVMQAAEAAEKEKERAGT